jgi:hypothetical protein
MAFFIGAWRHAEQFGRAALEIGEHPVAIEIELHVIRPPIGPE